MTRQYRDKQPFKKTPTLLVVTILACINTAYAYSAPGEWQTVYRLGSGLATADEVGYSKNISSATSGSDEFYYYSAKKPAQTSGIFDAMLGIERRRLNWLLQFGINYHYLSPYSAKGVLTQGIDQESEDVYEYQYSVSNRQVLVEGTMLYRSRPRFYTYLTAGVGAAFNKAYNYQTTVPPTLAFTREYTDKIVSSFSYALGAGFAADLDPSWRLGLGFRFTDFGRTALGMATVDSTPVPGGSLRQNHFYVKEFLVTLTAHPFV